MKIKFEFSSTTTFDQLSIGSVFIAGKNTPCMKIREFTIEETDIGGFLTDVPFNAVNLQNGELDWFDTDYPVFEMPTATLTF